MCLDSQTDIRSNPTSYEPNYLEFSKDKISCCWHCGKMLELYLLRAQAITFQRTGIDCALKSLARKSHPEWNQSDVDFFVDLYKHGPKN